MATWHNRPPRVLGNTEHAALCDTEQPTSYQGDSTKFRRIAANVPDEQLNCALFLKNLPADITHHELLASLHNLGRVFNTYINPPEPAKGHFTYAIKVVFFSSDPAQALFGSATVAPAYGSEITELSRSSAETKFRCCKPAASGKEESQGCGPSRVI